MMKRTSKRCRNDAPSSSSGAAEAFDFNAKAREFLLACDRASLDLDETRSKLKATVELVEQKNRELEMQKQEHDAAIEAENETVLQLTEERDEIARSRHALAEELRILKADTARERMIADQLRAENERLAEEARTERNEAVQIENEMRQLTSECDRLRGTIESAQDLFFDCITLHNLPGVLLTSGHMLNLEGLIGIWLDDTSFTGDIWFPFQCPLTNRTTAPVHELSEWIVYFACILCLLTSLALRAATLDFIDRLGKSLNLPSRQALYFQHRANPLNQEHQGQWRIYTLPEQLKIFSKLVQAFHRRDMADASFTVDVKPGHTLSVHVTQNRRNGDIVDYDFAVTLSITSFEGNRAIARQHCVQFVASHDVATRTFSQCNFVYPEPPVEIV